MGTYLCESASAAAIVFRHEGDDDHEITISAGISGALGHGSFAPVPQVFQDRAQAGKRYFVSVGLTEVQDAPAPAAAPLPAWAVQPDAARTAPAAQAAQDGAEDAPADIESDGGSDAATDAPAAQ